MERKAPAVAFPVWDGCCCCCCCCGGGGGGGGCTGGWNTTLWSMAENILLSRAAKCACPHVFSLGCVKERDTTTRQKISQHTKGPSGEPMPGKSGNNRTMEHKDAHMDRRTTDKPARTGMYTQTHALHRDMEGMDNRGKNSFAHNEKGYALGIGCTHKARERQRERERKHHWWGGCGVFQPPTTYIPTHHKPPSIGERKQKKQVPQSRIQKGRTGPIHVPAPWCAV